MILYRSTPPADTPVTLEEAKEHLMVFHNEHDTLINSLLQTAVAALEYPNEIGKAIYTQTWTYKLYYLGYRTCLPVTPVQSITSISYYDADEVLQELDVEDFYLYTEGEDVAFLEPKAGFQWPSIFNRRDAVHVEFVAGYGEAHQVPETIKLAIKLILTHWYENRGTISTFGVNEIPRSAEHLINLHRKGWAA